MYPTQLHSYLLWRSTVPPDPQSLAQRRYTAIASLFPAVMAGIFVFGWWAGVVILAATLSSLATDIVTHKYIYKDSPGTSDGTWFLTGLLLALMMPPNVPLWVPILGGIVAVFVGKHYLSVDGTPLLQPAALGLFALHVVGILAMIFMSYNPMNPSERWPVLSRGIETSAESVREGRFIGEFFGGDVRNSISRQEYREHLNKSSDAPPPAVHGPRPLELVAKDPSRPLSEYTKGKEDRYEWLDLLLGYVPGPIASSGLALAFGILLLVFARAHTWVIPFFAIVTMAGAMWAFAAMFGTSRFHPANIPIHLLTGSTILGIFYFAADPTVAPRSFLGKVYAGIAFGLIEVFFRAFFLTEGIVLTIVIVQGLSFVIDQYLAPPVEDRAPSTASLTPSSLGRL
ncbi:MAG TPA: RnfABCDGE type electron transport complex subunit D [Planctomycetota bacterium]|nr:RnfABCDGE type electron transport complex subunit D [Planctomycetota bacterium]